MPYFDSYIAVDWSANSKPNKGENSIWIARVDASGASHASVNPTTRTAAMVHIKQVLAEALHKGHRVIVGFDFAFGYPEGATKSMTGKSEWQALWDMLAARISDDEANRNNRFEVAAEINRDLEEGAARFWGRPWRQEIEHLSLKRPSDNHLQVPELRHVESLASGTQPVWKLSYVGSVGGQSLVGIPRLHALRHDPQFKDSIAIWPFETEFNKDLSRPIVLAEIYPSMLPIMVREGEVKDQVQVETFAKRMADLDVGDRLVPVMGFPPDQSPKARDIAVKEEGWVLGAGHAEMTASDYIHDPKEIYARSFATIRAEADLSRFKKDERDVAIRLIHACGMVDIVDDLQISKRAIATGRAALAKGAPIICDVRMVAEGVITRNLTANNKVICALGQDGADDFAEATGTTRSAAGIEMLKHNLAGAVIAIGNAPTSLFHLLTCLGEGVGKPALVLGFPVGFVGAAESKVALIANQFDVPYIALSGRRGGSALAAAAVNAVAVGLTT